MTPATDPQPQAPPYRRWFFWLLAGSVYLLVVPYFTNPDKSRLYSSNVQTFVETAHGLQPTKEHILIDGRSAAYMDSRFWLITALACITLDASVWGLGRWCAGKSNKSD
jgi:hypothetical protein